MRSTHRRGMTGGGAQAVDARDGAEEGAPGRRSTFRLLVLVGRRRTVRGHGSDWPPRQDSARRAAAAAAAWHVKARAARTARQASPLAPQPGRSAGGMTVRWRGGRHPAQPLSEGPLAAAHRRRASCMVHGPLNRDRGLPATAAAAGRSRKEAAVRTFRGGRWRGVWWKGGDAATSVSQPPRLPPPAPWFPCQCRPARAQPQKAWTTALHTTPPTPPAHASRPATRTGRGSRPAMRCRGCGGERTGRPAVGVATAGRLGVAGWAVLRRLPSCDNHTSGGLPTRDKERTQGRAAATAAATGVVVVTPRRAAAATQAARSTRRGPARTKTQRGGEG